MVFSSYKIRIVYLSQKGYKPPTISNILRQEGMNTSRRGIAKFLKWYQSTGTIARRPGSGWSTKVTEEVKKVVEEQMQLDDETTAYQLHNLLTSKGYGLSLYIQSCDVE